MLQIYFDFVANFQHALNDGATCHTTFQISDFCTRLYCYRKNKKKKLKLI